MRDVRPVAASTLTDGFLTAVNDALAGTGPALVPLPGDARDETILADLRPVPDDVCLLLPTSGSTGRPKLVMLTTAALRASVAATHEHLGGPGRWLLALPLTHVAGWQVVIRSLLAGLEPAATPAGSFTAAAFAAALHDVRYTSLVPTQLLRVLDDDQARARAAGLDGILVGGSAVNPALMHRVDESGLRVVRTYGMTETAGGCVYDGVPLPGVHLGFEDSGRIRIAGPLLAAGYLGLDALTAERFVTDGGRRVLRTDDLGRLVDRRLEVLGRVDDVVVTGGENVAPAAVETVVAGLPGVRDVIVVGVPDDVWGQKVVALLVGDVNEPELVRAVRDRCGRAAVPRVIHRVEAVPQMGIGKPDRRAALRLAAELEAGER